MFLIFLATPLAILVYLINMWYFTSTYIGSVSDVKTSYDLISNLSPDSLFYYLQVGNYIELYNLYGGEPAYLITRSILNLDASQFHSAMMAILFLISFKVNSISKHISQRLIPFTFFFPFFYGNLSAGNSRQLLYSILLITFFNIILFFAKKINFRNIVIFVFGIILLGFTAHTPSMLLLILLFLSILLFPSFISYNFANSLFQTSPSIKFKLYNFTCRIRIFTIFLFSFFVFGFSLFAVYFRDIIQSKLFYLTQGLSSYQLNFFVVCVLFPIVIFILLMNNFKLSQWTFLATLVVVVLPYFFGSGFWRVIAQLLIISTCCPKLLMLQQTFDYRLIFQSLAFISLPLSIINTIVKYS